MDGLSSYAVDPVSAQLVVLDLMLGIYIAAKGVAYTIRIVFRRTR